MAELRLENKAAAFGLKPLSGCSPGARVCANSGTDGHLQAVSHPAWTLPVVNVSLQPPESQPLAKFVRPRARQGVKAPGASRRLWLLMPGKSVLRFPGHVSFPGAASTTATNFCLQTRRSRARGNGPPTPSELRLRVSSSSHINQHPILFPVLSLLKGTLQLGPEFSYLNQIRKTDLLKRSFISTFLS